MWFKNVRLLTLSNPIQLDDVTLAKLLEPMTFRPCPKSLPSSYGFVPPLGDEDGPLVFAAQGCLLVKLRIEEKILPPSVVREQLNAEIKQIEASTGRRLYRDEKERLKDEVYQTLLTKAFSRSSYLHGYIDTERGWVVVDAASPKKLAHFVSLLMKCLDNQAFAPSIVPVPALATQWLLKQTYPAELSCANACLMKEADAEGSVVRVRNTDLECDKVQSFLKDGSLVTELTLEWSNQIRFTLKEDFCLSGLKFQETVKELARDGMSENAEERFAADFTLMAMTLRRFLTDMLSYLEERKLETQERKQLEEVSN